MRSWTARGKRLPLRARTAIAFGLTSMVLSGVLAFLAYGLVRNELYDERVSAAERQAYTNARLVRAGLRADPAQVTTLLSGLRVGPAGDALLRVRGEWFASSVGVDSAVIPIELLAGIDEGRAGHQPFRAAAGPQLAVGVPIAEFDAVYFEVTTLGEVEASLAVLASSLAIAGAVATVIGATVGAVSSGTVLRPLRRMAGVARRIVDGEVDSRLDAEGDRDLVPLVASFNEMLDDLRDRIQREARFASDVTHELRGPLTALASAVEVVKRRKAELPERAVYAVEVLDAQVQAFNQLVLDLLEISRFDAGAALLDLRPIDLEAFFRAVLTDRGEDVRLDISPDARFIEADPRRLQQIVANLLDNARNYAGGATAIVVDRSPGLVRLAVEDAGPGVPDEEKSRVFERFDRGSRDADESAPSGTGLGLALVAEHARLHGGRVWVEDVATGGARFVVELPERL